MSAFDPWYTKHPGPMVTKTYVDTWLGRSKMDGDVRGATSFGWEVVKQDLVDGHAKVATIIFWVFVGFVLFWTIVAPLVAIAAVSGARTKAKYLVLYRRPVSPASVASPVAPVQYSMPTIIPAATPPAATAPAAPVRLPAQSDQVSSGDTTSEPDAGRRAVLVGTPTVSVRSGVVRAVASVANHSGLFMRNARIDFVLLTSPGNELVEAKTTFTDIGPQQQKNVTVQFDAKPTASVVATATYRVT